MPKTEKQVDTSRFHALSTLGKPSDFSGAKQALRQQPGPRELAVRADATVHPSQATFACVMRYYSLAFSGGGTKGFPKKMTKEDTAHQKRRLAFLKGKRAFQV